MRVCRTLSTTCAFDEGCASLSPAASCPTCWPRAALTWATDRSTPHTGTMVRRCRVQELIWQPSSTRQESSGPPSARRSASSRASADAARSAWAALVRRSCVSAADHHSHDGLPHRLHTGQDARSEPRIEVGTTRLRFAADSGSVGTNVALNVAYGCLYAYTPEVLPSAHRATGVRLACGCPD